MDISTIGPFAVYPASQHPPKISNGTNSAYLSNGAFSYLVFEKESVKIKGVITPGNYKVISKDGKTPIVEFPIVYEEPLHSFPKFKQKYMIADVNKDKVLTLVPQRSIRASPSVTTPSSGPRRSARLAALQSSTIQPPTIQPTTITTPIESSAILTHQSGGRRSKKQQA
jgi:hypothetical protein